MGTIFLIYTYIHDFSNKISELFYISCIILYIYIEQNMFW